MVTACFDPVPRAAVGTAAPGKIWWSKDLTGEGALVADWVRDCGTLRLKYRSDCTIPAVWRHS